LVKRILLPVLQFIAFLLLLDLGGYWDVVRLSLEFRYPTLPLIPLWKIHFTAAHDLILNGIVYATALLFLIFLIEILRKALKPWALFSAAAFILAILTSFILGFGFLPVS
jgi:hypothetical protein